tara:strand:- start:297 stop:899 length:603 start_codon:yes stop_codon:yes gene_type:complete
MATNIKITALNDITSANMTYNDIVAVVDMNGTPETKKANVQLVGNLILSGSGGSNFAKAAEATNAETVSNAAQPAITSVGTLTAVTVTGNVAAGNVSGTGGVFTYVSGDGANLTNITTVGTLTALEVTGNITGQSYVSAATALQTTPVITSALPTAATAGAGARSMVTDADAGSTFGAVLVGAGSLTLPVFSDGTDWRVG